MKTDKNSNTPKLLKYLKSHELMVVATKGKRPTAAAVYYGIDDHFNVYMVTSPDTEHGKNIEDNHLVACAIVDTHQPMFQTKYKIGVQLQGTVHEIHDPEEMKKAFSIWAQGRKDVVELFMKNITEGIWESRIFLIRPAEIKWFNEKLYGEEGTEIFTF